MKLEIHSITNQNQQQLHPLGHQAALSHLVINVTESFDWMKGQMISHPTWMLRTVNALSLTVEREVKSKCDTFKVWIHVEVSIRYVAMKAQVFSSLTDLRNSGNENSAVFDVYSNKKGISFRNFVFLLGHLTAPDFSSRILTNKIFYDVFCFCYKSLKSYGLTQERKDSFFWFYVASVFIMGNKLPSNVDSIFFDSFPFTVVDLSLLYLDRHCCMSLVIILKKIPKKTVWLSNRVKTTGLNMI